MSIKIKMSAFIPLVSALLFATPSLAATQAQIDNARANGIAWLIQNQNGDGSWGNTDISNRMAATTESMEALRRSGADYGHLHSRALSWVANAKTDSVDSLARKIEQLEKEGLNSEELGLMQELMVQRNVANKCWGSFEYHNCSFPDTSLAMDAILNARITSGYLYSDDFATLDLIMSSHAPYPAVNGWSYIAAGDESDIDQKVMPTAYTIITLFRYYVYYQNVFQVPAPASYSQAYGDMEDHLSTGASWLLGKSHADGSIRDDASIATGTVQSTALAYLSIATLPAYGLILPSDVQAKLNNALDFIISQQQADGSWEGDALVTALAVRSFSAATMTDTDSDGIPDSVEVVLGTDPNVSDGRGYIDNNGLDPDNLQDTGLSAVAIMREIIVNQAFSHTPTVSGGTPGYSWSVLTGSLPSGISLVSSITGALSGTPTYVGSQTFALQAQDAAGNNIIVPVHIRVLAADEETDSDGDGYSSAIELSFGTDPLDVNSVPIVPLAGNDSGYSLDQSGVLNTAIVSLPSVLANDIDSDTPNASLIAVLNTQASNGSVVLNSDGSFVYTHNGGQLLSDSFTYYVNDGVNNSPTAATVSIVINNVAPVAYDADIETTADTEILGTLAADDVGADALTFSVSSNGALGVANISNAATGAYTYTPNAGMTGTDSFGFYANDGLLDSNIAVVSVTINTATPPPATGADVVYEYDVTKKFGGTSSDYATGSAVDSAGNLYVAGHFGGTVDFDPSTTATDAHTSSGSIDSYVTRFNADGSYGWTRTFGGTSHDYVEAVAVDGFGDIYVTGKFYGSADFDPSASDDTRSTAGNYDAYITKLLSNGNYGWTRTIGGTGIDNGMGIAVDSLNNIYTTGSFFGSVDFDPTAGVDNQSSGGGYDVFVTKLQPDGSYGWSEIIGGLSNDYGDSIAIDTANNIYVTGQFSGQVDFNNGPGLAQHDAVGGLDVFVTKLQADRSHLWTQTFGGATGDDYNHNIAIDDLENVYLTGTFVGSADFDPDPLVDETHTSNGKADVYLVKYNADGSYGWARTHGGTEDDYGDTVAVDSVGHVLMGGGFAQTVDFDPGTGDDTHTALFFTSSAMNSGPFATDIFLTRYKNDGSYDWTYVPDRGTSRHDRLRSISVTNNGDLYLVGDFNYSSYSYSYDSYRNIDFNPNPDVWEWHTATRYNDVFVSHWITHPDTDGDGVMDSNDVFPNDSAEWLDTDNDGIGNNADSDDDNDGLTDVYEISQGLNPLNGEDVGYDPDGDGLSNAEELLTTGTNHLVTDSDGDGMSDGFEVTYGLNPLDGSDGVLDSDGDGVSNLDEFYRNSDPIVSDASVSYEHLYGGTQGIGGGGHDYTGDVAVDSSGNVYLTGYFSYTVDFDPGAGVDQQTALGSFSQFVTRLNADGSYGWTRIFNGDTGAYMYSSIAVDAIGNVYIGARYDGTEDFDPGAGVDQHTSQEAYDSYLMKLHADGSYGWTKSFPGALSAHVRAIDIDGNGNIYLTGAYRATMDFDPGAGVDQHIWSLGYSAGDNLFVTRINADGSYGWTRSTQSSGKGINSSDIDVDSNGNIYVLGSFFKSSDFDPTDGEDIQMASNDFYYADIFLMQLLPNGDYGWTRVVGSAGRNETPYGVSADDQGSVYVTGDFRGTVDFDPTANVDSYSNNTNPDAFVSKYSADGSYHWTHPFGGSSSDYGYSVTTGTHGEVFVGGAFKSTVDFKPGGGDSHTATGSNYDLFVTMIKSDGSYGWTGTAGSYYADYVKKMTVGANGNLYVFGETYNSVYSVDFDPGPGVDYLKGVAGRDTYITQWNYSLVPAP